jgi:hypothetical protein
MITTTIPISNYKYKPLLRNLGRAGINVIARLYHFQVNDLGDENYILLNTRSNGGVVIDNSEGLIKLVGHDKNDEETITRLDKLSLNLERAA